MTLDLPFTIPFTIGPTTMAYGYKHLSPRQEVRVFIWPSNHMPDPDSGLSYFYLLALQ